MQRPSSLHVFGQRMLGLGAFLTLIWGLQALNWATLYGMNARFGLIPRRIEGLDGIFGMPLLHGSFDHLMANTPPLVLMGALLCATATRALFAVNLVIVGLGGALVWLFASTAIHIGASGLIFGWFGFLLARGLVDRSPMTLGAAAIVGAVYGTLIFGVFPGEPGISWEAHLFGAIAGVVAAIVVPSNIHPPRMRDVERL